MHTVHPRSVLAVILAFIFALTSCSQAAPPQATQAVPTAAAAKPAATQAAPAISTQAPQPAATQAPAAAQPAAPYRLGVLLPLTGSYAVYGTDVINGVNFLVEKINKAGGIKGLGGAKIEIVTADTVADTKIALTEFERLVSKEKVDAVIGPFATTVIYQIGPWADRYQTPTIPVGGYADEMYKQHVKFAVHLGPSNERLAAPAMNNLLDMVEEFNLPRERIVLFSPDSETYRTKSEVNKRVLKERGYEKNLVDHIFAPPDLKDLSSAVLKLKSLKPDILMSDSSGAFAPLMVRAMESLDFYPAVWSESLAMFDPKTRQAVGEPMWTKVVRRPGVIGYDYDHPDVPLPGVQAFKAEIEPWLKAKNQPYTTRVPYAQALYALVKVMDEIKTKDKIAVNDALHKMSMKDSDPLFIASQFSPGIEWDADGKPKNFRLFGTQVQMNDGKESQVLIYPKSMRPASVKPWVK